MKPSKIIDKMGGHGLAAIFDSQEKGPTLLFRAELDALPIQEKIICLGSPNYPE